MQFMEAIKALQEGKMVVRECWNEEENGYLKLMYGLPYVWRILMMPNPNAGSFSFSIDEMVADDWVLFPKPVKEVVDNIEL
jgi:hypothetical protein